jgi:hypothetical protein
MTEWINHLPIHSMTIAADPDTTGVMPRVVETSFIRLSPKKLCVLVTFVEPIVGRSRPEVKFGMLLVDQVPGRTIAISIDESGLWSGKWTPQTTKTTWSRDRRVLRVEISLPDKYPNIPDAPPRTFRSFSEGRWPFMTKAQWIQALDHRNKL